MSDRRLPLGLLVVVLVVGGACWAYARISAADRITELASTIRRIGYARGGNPPTDEEARARVEALAAEHGVELDALVVSSRESSTLDGAGRVAQKRLGSLGTLTMRTRRYEVRGNARASKWLWSVTRDLSATFVLRVQVSMETGGPTAPAMEPPAYGTKRGR